MQRQTSRRREILNAKCYPRPADLDYPDSSVEVVVDDGEYVSFYSEGRRGAIAIDYETAILNVEDHR